MRTLKALLLSSVLSSIVVLCLAGSAMAAPQKATVSGVSVTPGGMPEFGQDQLHLTLDDQGAWDDTGDGSTYSLNVFQVATNSCSAAGNPDYNLKSQTSGDIYGQQEVQLDIYQSGPGTPYCAVVHVDSAWGSAYNNDFYIPFYGGQLPEVYNVTASAKYSDITVSGRVTPGYLVTDYLAETLLLDGSETCSSPTHVNSSHTQLGGTYPLEFSGTVDQAVKATGLLPHSDYCARMVGSNSFGDVVSSWIPVSTGDETDTEAPSDPTNLTYSDLVGQSVTLHWGGSTDDHTVAGYRIIWSYGMAGGPVGGIVNALSATIPISCDSKNNHYTIIAVDDQGNASGPSNQITLDGTKCAAPPAGPGAGGDGSGGGSAGGNNPDDTNPNFDSCVNPIKAQNVTGRANHKKISVTVSGNVADDDQSIVIRAKVKGTDVTFKVNGKKVDDRKNAITVKKKPATVTVSFKIGSKTKTITVKTTVSDC
jgi:hypothetical protein